MGQGATFGVGRGIGPGGIRAKWRLVPLVLALAPAWGAPAAAATDTVVTLRGDVVPACAVAGLTTSVDLGNLTASGTTTLAFTTTCNAPFRYSLSSGYGGLRHSSGATAPGGFSAVVPYSVRTILPTDAGTIDQTCTSASILEGSVTCVFTDSGTGIAIGQSSELRLGWTGVPNLLGGSYSDNLTLTIGIRP